MLMALTRGVSPDIEGCELTYRQREPIDYRRALEQHEEYCRQLRDCGAEQIALDAGEALPDCCFVADTAVVVDEVAVISSMGAASRRGEMAAVEPLLARYRQVVRVEPPATAEGGDTVCVGRRLFVGLSRRTSAQGVEALRRILRPFGYEVAPVRVRGSLHLSTACSALDEETVLLNPHWIDAEPFARFNVLRVPEEEPWAANTLRVGETVCVEAMAPRTEQLVRRYNKSVRAVDISEFRKAEGSLSCLSIVFNSGESGGPGR
jgi:dimethylargininase